MGTVHDEAEPVDLGHDAPAQRCEADIRTVTAAGNGIVAIVGEMDLTYAQIPIEREHREVILEHHRALEVEAHCEFPLNLGALDVLDRPREYEVLRVLLEPGAKSRDHMNHLR
jgi:hypothetical protein